MMSIAFKILLIGFSALLAPESHAKLSGPMWTCHLDVNLVGDARYYRVYGVDSWRGQAPVHCESSEGRQTHEIDVVFISRVGDVGAGQYSKLAFRADFQTLLTPAEFQVRSVDSVVDDSEFRWQFASQFTTLTAVVKSPLTPSLRSSLSQGSLFLGSEVLMSKW